MPEFKDMLKYFRMREGLSQNELANKLGVSTSRISMYEAGKREPDFETEEKIADFFNTDLNTLRGRDTESNIVRVERLFSGGGSISSAEFEKMVKESISALVYPDAMPEAVKRVQELTEISRRATEPVTIAAHFDGDEYTAEELEEIKQFAEFVKNRRK